MTYSRLLFGLLLVAGLLPLGLGAVTYFMPREGLPYLGVGLVTIAVAFAAVGARLLAEPIQRLRGGVEVMVGANPRFRLWPGELRDVAALAAGVNRLAERAEQARTETESQLLAATRELAIEKDTLASILFALADGVVVCNAELEVVLSNAVAQRMLSLPARPLRRGERLQAYLDPVLVGPLAEALETDDAGRLERATATLPNGATAQLTATVAGSEELGRHYVFVVRDVTRQVAEDRVRDRFVVETVQRLRSPAASVLSLAEILSGYGELDEPRQREFLDALVKDAERLADELDAIQETAGHGLAPSWAEDLEVDRLVERAVIEAEVILGASGQRISSGGEPATVQGDRLALLQLVRRLVELAAARAADHSEIAVRWRVIGAPERSALVELSIEAPGVRLGAADLERVFDAPLHQGQIDWTEAALTVRSVAQEHRGELWARSTSGGTAFVLAMPAAPPRSAAAPGLEADAVGRQVLALLGHDGFYHLRPPSGRPEPAHADATLAGLSFAVFDLETTGLEPGADDRVVSIGGVRVRDGQIIREDYFFSLIQPGRPIAPASTRIHGITDEMVAGKPRLEEVLPRFVEYVGESVPVAHVASFDLAFLNPRLEALGLPPLGGAAVLDTLLLCYSLFPTWDGYNLEEIAQHFDVPVVGRHTSLGDALATAEILLRLLAVLDQRGVKTLRDALQLQSGDAVRKAVGAVRARLAWG